MTAVNPKINRKTLKRECWRKGLSVAQLARRIKRSRSQLYRALTNPERHGPTVHLIRKVLND